MLTQLPKRLHLKVSELTYSFYLVRDIFLKWQNYKKNKLHPLSTRNCTHITNLCLKADFTLGKYNFFMETDLTRNCQKMH